MHGNEILQLHEIFDDESQIDTFETKQEQTLESWIVRKGNENQVISDDSEKEGKICEQNGFGTVNLRIVFFQFGSGMIFDSEIRYNDILASLIVNDSNIAQFSSLFFVHGHFNHVGFPEIFSQTVAFDLFRSFA